MAQQSPADTRPERAGGPDGRARWQLRACAAALALLAAAYLAQIASPLRLTPDAVVYLSMAQSATEGHGFTLHGHTTQYPPGYPAVIFVLDSVGLGTSWALVAANCVLLAVGLAAFYVLLREVFALQRTPALLVCAFTMLSFPFFKHVALPLSDITFFAPAMLCVLVATRLAQASGRKRAAMVALALALAAAATAVRTVGITLVPAVLWACVAKKPEPGSAAPRVRSAGRTIARVALLLAAAAILGVAASHTAYFRHMRAEYSVGFSATVQRVITYRLTECEQLAANGVPYNIAPALLQQAIPIFGVFALGLVALALWMRRRNPGPVEVYVACNLLILMVWPYWDARFWLPVLPLIMAMVAQLMAHVARTRLARALLAAYLTLFALMGLAGLAYNTRISLSGASFPDRYRYPGLEATYEAAWGRRSAEDPAVNADALRVLRRYEPRAASAPERRAE